MWKHAEAFHEYKGYKLTIFVLFTNCKKFFKIEICSTLFKRYLNKNEALQIPIFVYENESLQHYLSCDMRQISTILVLEIRFFSTGPFLEVPCLGPDLVFR